jgi:hypothetical protein
VFYENWTWNFQVRTSGDTESRGTHYCDGHLFSLNNVYAGNAWDFYFGRGASGKLFQFQGNWYWDWNISNGNLRWVAGGNVMLEMFPGYDNQWGHYFPCYNRNGAFVGFGSLTFMERGSALRSHARSPHALDAVMKIDAVRYQRRTKRRVQEGEIVVPDHEFQPEIGFLAEDVADIIPEAANVAADPKETVGTVNPLALTAVLWMAVKELAAEVKALKGSAA